MSLLDFDAPPDQYAVMGNPIAHSKSPLIHNQFALQCKQRLEYKTILVDLGGLPQAVGNFQGQGGRGLNITVPFKQDAWKLAERLNQRAQRAGAVNTLIIEGDGALVGDNTDGIGLVRDLSENLQLPLIGKRILMLGAGGAVRGVLAPLMFEQPASLVIANRTVSKAEALVQKFSDMGSLRASSYERLEGEVFDIIINGTAASLSGDLPPLPDHILVADGACYDMMYAQEPTPFMVWAEEQGASVNSDGLGMLVEQAAESFYLWRGVRPDTADVIASMR